MDLEAAATVSAPVSTVVDVLADLATYPHWLTIVGQATPAPTDDADPGPAWAVDLIGRVGPLVKRKRVRMVRMAFEVDDGSVRFERCELDGRSHNAWILTGSATASDRGTDVRVGIHYGGGRSLPGADLLLRQEVRRAGDRLETYLRTR